jgi:hypothetical protein
MSPPFLKPMKLFNDSRDSLFQALIIIISLYHVHVQRAGKKMIFLHIEFRRFGTLVCGVCSQSRGIAG